MIDLQLSADQREIVHTVEVFLEQELPLERLRPSPVPSPNRDQHQLRRLGELGYLSLGLPEAAGGVGLGPPEEVLIFREFGRRLVTPAILGAVVGTHLAAAGGDGALASALAAADSRVGLGIMWPPVDATGAVGERAHLIEAEAADFILMWGPAGAGLWPLSAFRDVAPQAAIDSTLTLSRAVLGDMPPTHWAASDVSDASARATLLNAAMMVGMAEAARDGSVAYVKLREQFGQPIGAFQSVKHRCSDMAVRASAAWAQTLFAGLVLSVSGRDAGFQIGSARIVATDAAYRNGAANIQNHGGIGFTGEAEPHLFLKRAHILDQLGGALKLQQRMLLNEPASH